MQTSQRRQQQQQQETAPLFERLGGKSGIREIVDDVVDAHMQNPVIRPRFLPYAEEPERLAVIKKHTCDFFAAGSGGPVEYKGRSMPDTHRGMNISEAEYMAVMDDILEVLRAHGVDERSQNDVLAILYSLKSEIMRH